MNQVEYSFAVLSYTHDPASGESLNVGVVLTAPDFPYANALWEERTKRLSDAFRDFSAQTFNEAKRDFLHALGAHRFPYRQHRLFSEATDAGTLVRSIWPDGGLSYRVGRSGTGATTDPEATLRYLFERYVLDQQPIKRAEQGVSDEQVWKSFQARSPLLRRIKLADEPFVVPVPGAPLEFDYAAKNGKWHLLQPLSFDLARSESIRDKAAKWAGFGHMISQHKEVAQLVFLLGAPQNPLNLQAYKEAKGFLGSVKLVSEILDDLDADDVDSRVASIVQNSGLHLLGQLDLDDSLAIRSSAS